LPSRILKNPFTFFFFFMILAIIPPPPPTFKNSGNPNIYIYTNNLILNFSFFFDSKSYVSGEINTKIRPRTTLKSRKLLLVLLVFTFFFGFRVLGGGASAYFYEISIFFHLKNMILHIEFFFGKFSHLFDLNKYEFDTWKGFMFKNWP